MIRAVIMAFAVFMFAACGEDEGSAGENQLPVIEGMYSFSANETENTCNSKGPRGEFSMPLETYVYQDSAGHISFWGGGIHLSLALSSDTGLWKLSLDKGDCLLEDWFGGLSISCKDESMAVTLDATFDTVKLWMSGSMRLDYETNCGEDGTASGYNKILLEGGQEPFAYECKSTAFRCYLDDACTQLLPGCVTAADKCSSLAKAYKSSAGECTPAPSSVSSALSVRDARAVPNSVLVAPAWWKNYFRAASAL